MADGRRTLGTAALLAFSIAVSGALQAQETPADRQYATAVALASQKQNAEAIAALRKFLADNPTHPKAAIAQVRLADLLLVTNQPDMALKALTAALALKPEGDVRADALFGTARAQVALKQDEKALEALNAAFDLTEYDDDRGPKVALLLGDTLFRMDRYEPAARAYYRVTRWPAFPEAPRSYFRVGEAYRLAGSHPDAAIAFQKTAERYPRDTVAPEAWLAAGGEYLVASNLDDAEAAYRHVVQDYTSSSAAPHAQLGLGQVEVARGNFSIARSAFQAAALLFEKSGIGSEADLRIADTYRAERNADEARQRYGELVTAPDHLVAGEARYSLAQMLQEGGQIMPAVEQYHKLSEDRAAGRWSQLGRLRLAEVRQGSGDLVSAIALLRSVRAEKAEPAIRDEAAYDLAGVLADQGEFAAAEQELSGLPAQAPFAYDAALLIARCRLEQGDAPGAALRAEDLLKKELSPEHRAAALTFLARVQIAQKQPAAPATLREVLEKHAAAPAAAEAARLLLTYYRDAKEDAQAEELEKLIVQKYAAAGTAMDAALLQAEKTLASGAYGNAAGLYRQLLDRRPERALRLKARAGLAEASAFQKQPSAAMEQVAAIERDAPAPGFVAATQLRLARAYEKAGSRADALAAYRAARAAGPDAETAPEVLLGLGRALSASEKPAEAEPVLIELLDRYPKSARVPEALYAQAWCEVDLARPDAARPLFDRLVTEYPKHRLAGDAAFRLGEREYDAGNYEGAVRWYRKAAGSDLPAAAGAQYKLGWALRHRKDHAAAAEAFAAAAARLPVSLVALESRVRAGEEYLALEQDSKALEQFALVVAAAPGTDEERELIVEARLGTAQAYLASGDFEKGRNLSAEIAVPSNGWTGARAQLVRAEAVFLKDGPKAALPEYARAAGVFGKYRDVAAEAQFRIGECAESLGDARGARAAWQKAADLYPDMVWGERSGARIAAADAARAQAAKGASAALRSR